MIIDFEKMPEAEIEGFKGGKGMLLMRSWMDDKCRVMKSVLKPGASSGLHLHEQNCEVILVLRGSLTFHQDGNTETAKAGQVHYCAMGHEHYMENLTDEDVEYFALVCEHH